MIAVAILVAYVFYVLLYGVYHLIKTGVPQKTNYPLMAITVGILLVLLFFYVQNGYYQH